MSEAQHTPVPWGLSQAAKGKLDVGTGETTMGDTFPTVVACEQPKGVNGRGVTVAEIITRDSSIGFGDLAIHYSITPGVAAANAEFIVRACNSHYELLDALELLTGWYDDDDGVRDRIEALKSNEEEPTVTRLVEIARAAIAKAKGGDA